MKTPIAVFAIATLILVGCGVDNDPGSDGSSEVDREASQGEVLETTAGGTRVETRIEPDGSIVSREMAGTVVVATERTNASELAAVWKERQLPPFASAEAKPHRLRAMQLHDEAARALWAAKVQTRTTAYCDSYTNYCAGYCDGALMCTTCCTSYSPCYTGSTFLARMLGC
jgi:hypothetical protein